MMKPRRFASVLLTTFLAAWTNAEEVDKALDRLLEDNLIGYLAVTKEHSSDSLEKLLTKHEAQRVRRFVVLGFAQGVPSVVYTIVEKPDESWVDVSWMLDGWEKPKVFRTELLEGDISAWSHLLKELDHEQLKSVDDKRGKSKLDGRSIWLAVKSKEVEFQYGFPNPSFSELPGLQSIRFIDLLGTAWGVHSFGPAMYDYEPNPGTAPLPNPGEQAAGVKRVPR
jgi:hypothetical protein